MNEQDGIDHAKQLESQVAGDLNARAVIAAAKNRFDAWLNAYDMGEGSAQKVFADSKPAEFAVVRAAEVAKKLGELDQRAAEAAKVEAVEARVK